MNTKRILSMVLFVALLVCAVASFSSCKKTEHQHTFAAEWSTDATNHWHAANCEHTEEKADLAAHVDANKDAKCDTCAYAMPTSGGNTGNTNTNKPTAPKSVVYTVTVVNAKGEVVEGVKVKLIDKEYTNYGDATPEKSTAADGKVSFDIAPKNGWLAQVVEAPAGYASELVSKQVAGESTEDTADDTFLEFVKQYEFDAENNVTIVLVDAPVVETPDAGTEGTDPAPAE